MKGIATLLSGLLLLALPGIAAEDVPEPDARVRAALERLGYPYQLNAFNAYQLLFELKGGRSQSVYVNSQTDTYSGLMFREVISRAYTVEGALSAEQANALLADNAQRVIGAWRTLSSEGRTYVLFAIQIDAAADDKTLELALKAAMTTADKLEAAETGKDEN